MKIRTVFERRIPKKILKKQNRVIMVALTLLNIIFTPVLPFMFGFYFGITTNWWLLVMFFFFIFFEVKFMLNKDGTIKINIVRGL